MLSSSYPEKSSVVNGLLFTLFLFAICLCGSIFLPDLAGPNLSLSVLFFISRLLFWLALALVYLYCVKIEKQPIILWAEKNYGALFYCVSTILLIVVITAGSVAIHLIAHFFKWSDQTKAMQTLLNFNIPLKLFIVVTAAFVEEIIFRGYIMSRLQLFFKGAWWPVVISSLVFGLAHFHYGTFVNIAGPVFIGFVFAWHYQKYRNLKVLMLCHFLIDFTALFFNH